MESGIDEEEIAGNIINEDMGDNKVKLSHDAEVRRSYGGVRVECVAGLAGQEDANVSFQLAIY